MTQAVRIEPERNPNPVRSLVSQLQLEYHQHHPPPTLTQPEKLIQPHPNTPFFPRYNPHPFARLQPDHERYGSSPRLGRWGLDDPGWGRADGEEGGEEGC